MPDATWGDSYAVPSKQSTAKGTVATSQDAEPMSSMKPLTVSNPAPLIDPAIVQAAIQRLANQSVSTSQQVNQVLPSRPNIPSHWRVYSQIVLGRPLRGPPHVLWCGYYSPATQPAILFAEAPHAPPACSPNNPNIKAFNHIKYWTRPVDLPINR